MKQLQLYIRSLTLIALYCVSPAHAEPLTDSSAAIAAALAYSGLGPYIQPAEKRELCITADLKSVSESAMPLVSGKSVDCRGWRTSSCAN